MMVEEQVKAIQNRLKDNWLATPIGWDGVEYTPERGKSFITIQVSWSGSDLISGTSDAGLYRDEGLIMIQVFTPRGEGVLPNQSFCDSLMNIYRGWTTGDLFCGAPYVVRTGEEQEWYQQNIYIPFHYDNCFTQEI